jgi:hypothetical protein
MRILNIINKENPKELLKIEKYLKDNYPRERTDTEYISELPSNRVITFPFLYFKYHQKINMKN